MIRHSFRFQILLLTLVPALSITGLLVMFFIETRLTEVDIELSARGSAIARQLAPACEYGIFAHNKDVLVRLVRSALTERDVIGATIRDQRGEVLADAHSSNTDGLTTNAGERKKSRVFRATVTANDVSIDDFPASPIDGVAATAVRDRELGTVEVELSEAAMLHQQQTILWQSILLAFGVLSLISVVAIGLARRVSVPVSRLAAALNAIRDGALDTRIPVSSGGELGSLEQGVNSMASALQAARVQELARAEDSLFLEKVRAQATLQCLGEGVVATDASGFITYLNTAAEQLLGWSAKQARGHAVRDVLQRVGDDSTLLEEEVLGRCIQLGVVIRSDGYCKLQRRDGSQISVRESAAPIRDRNGELIGAVLVLLDVTQMYALAQQLSHQANHDALTGMLNRRAFEARLQQTIDSVRRDLGAQHVLCYIDLDQFKVVNDTCGHAAGDEMLRQLSFIIQHHLRRGDTVARLGGDEFGVILENCAVPEALPLMDNLRVAVGAFRFGWGEQSFDVGLSVGMVAIVAESGTLQDVLRAADSACYVAKELGRNRIHLYQPHDEALLRRRGEMQWVTRLKRGFDENRFVLFSQAIHPLGKDCPIRAPDYEITVMLQSEDSATLTPPMAFIPAAERFNLMPNLDRWVIEAALRQLGKSNAAALRTMQRLPVYAINLSGQSLNDSHFLSFVSNLFDEVGIAPGQICFEITETAAIANLSNATLLLRALRNKGCSIALDDFGSGLSSFGYLKHLPVDLLKIDGGIVKDIAHDPVSLSMVEAINQIGHVMGLATIAEFVESAAIAEKLKELRVDYGQGFYLDTPERLKMSAVG